MNNIRIEVKGDNYITVTADTPRFGKNEIMYEGNTFDQCFQYVKDALGVDRIRLQSCFIWQVYKDRNGRQFPIYMEVAE